MVILNWANGCASLNQTRPQDSEYKPFKKYYHTSQKYQARISSMATTADLESVVVNTVQAPGFVGPAENPAVGANNANPASSAPSQASDHEHGHRHRSNQNSETDNQQTYVQSASMEAGTLTPANAGSKNNKSKVYERKVKNSATIK